MPAATGALGSLIRDPGQGNQGCLAGPVMFKNPGEVFRFLRAQFDLNPAEASMLAYGLTTGEAIALNCRQ
jgi:hypothetical protein